MTTGHLYDVAALTTEPNPARVYDVAVETEVAETTRARVYRVSAATLTSQARVYRVEAATEIVLTANAGPDQTVEALSRVHLSGLASGGNPVEWSWSQTAGPLVALEPSATVPQPSFVAPATDEGTTVAFELTVGDGEEVSAVSDAVQITVRPHTQWAFLPTPSSPGGAWVPYLLEA